MIRACVDLRISKKFMEWNRIIKSLDVEHLIHQLMLVADFNGYKFTKDGFKPTHEKVRAVKEAKAPVSKEAARSILGMIGYLSKFIQRYTLPKAPLRKIMHKDTNFIWENKKNSAFEKLEDSITNESTMAFFKPMRPIELHCVASFNEGLSGGLFQQTNKGLQPVHFISRSLTDIEKRYSQTEKDTLSIRWIKNIKEYIFSEHQNSRLSQHINLLYQCSIRLRSSYRHV
ncbi:unnamed protein product [Mytilus edulis]|uniref:Reverse transcriptase/retrotransposon-derived protein RNase H-like domain-containing protein n=1 Tax=Mytilus edulis TaxID=6550 RepID=A0A8S3VES5_MYTED|nr:unnamed protein product [Mytilus edulis]